MIKAKIQKDPEGRGLWLTTEHEENSLFDVRYAIDEDEVVPILKACRKWMEEE